ncbi:selenium binding protein, partial [Acinetobacter pittii]|uniref:selenium binding protein n=2 Tax=Acinetobacter calcoaceticus/baumannii complex TaxID=909768 RepID=UPI0008396611
MYESYTRQALPSKKYRELIGTAICVFNSNNSFIIENILRVDQTGQYEWHKLIDKMSGRLSDDIEKTITAKSDATIAQLFSDIVDIRNRIVHSFQITAPAGITDD